jgi:hypothetical protein
MPRLPPLITTTRLENSPIAPAPCK